MKPSEFFIKTRINNQKWYDSDEANEYTIKELDKQFIDKKELNKALYDLNKDNYDNVYLYGDIITGRIERTLYNIEKKINKNIDIQKKAFKDSKIIKKRIKENKKILELLEE